MDGHDDPHRRQSSLPRSLIPHLFRHPSSATRTTLHHLPRSHPDPGPPPPPSSQALPYYPYANLPRLPSPPYFAYPDPYAPTTSASSSTFQPASPPRPAKRRRADSPTATKQSKTAVACNFCRGRKLRCNGARPACSHCAARQISCEYVSTPKRRGPGKAPKGTRAKKAPTLQAPDPQSSNNIDDRPSSPGPGRPQLHHPYDERRPYSTHVMALDTLDIFAFQPHPSAPRYPSLSAPPPDPRSEYYSHRRETSSEDRSGAEWE